MDIYLTNLKTKEQLRIPMLPTEISGTISNKFATYNILKNGDVQIPSGTSLDTYTWSALFPGKKRKHDPYIKCQTTPKKCDTFMRHLKAKNGKPVKARLMVTGTHINLDVYLQNYTPTETGGYGDIQYSVTFIRAKKITVRKIVKKKKAKGMLQNLFEQEEGTLEQGENTLEREKDVLEWEDRVDRVNPLIKDTYTVALEDSLWKIAQKVYGAGAEYTKIYEANKKTIGSDPNAICPGQVLTIP